MGTFYHTTNYNPLTGDLNNMAKLVPTDEDYGETDSKENKKRGWKIQAKAKDKKKGNSKEPNNVNEA